MLIRKTWKHEGDVFGGNGGGECVGGGGEPIDFVLQFCVSDILTMSVPLIYVRQVVSAAVYHSCIV